MQYIYKIYIYCHWLAFFMYGSLSCLIWWNSMNVKWILGFILGKKLLFLRTSKQVHSSIWTEQKKSKKCALNLGVAVSSHMMSLRKCQYSRIEPIWWIKISKPCIEFSIYSNFIFEYFRPNFVLKNQYFPQRKEKPSQLRLSSNLFRFWITAWIRIFAILTKRHWCYLFCQFALMEMYVGVGDAQCAWFSLPNENLLVDCIPFCKWFWLERKEEKTVFRYCRWFRSMDNNHRRICATRPETRSRKQIHNRIQTHTYTQHAQWNMPQRDDCKHLMRHS